MSTHRFSRSFPLVARSQPNLGCVGVTAHRPKSASGRKLPLPKTPPQKRRIDAEAKTDARARHKASVSAIK
jgi:hypothetical protein